MTESEYIAAVDRCIKIPGGPDWNGRFLSALSYENLKLSTDKEDENSILAPWPTSDEPFRWARMSYIVRA